MGDKVRASPRTDLSPRKVWKAKGGTDRGLLPLQVVSHNHLLQFHDVGVLELQEQGDLPQAADGHSWGREGGTAVLQERPGAGASARAEQPLLPPLTPPLPSFSLSIRTFFSATVSSVSVSRARSGDSTGHLGTRTHTWACPDLTSPPISAAGGELGELQTPPDPKRAGFYTREWLSSARGQGWMGYP